MPSADDPRHDIRSAQWLTAVAVTFVLHYAWEMLQAPWFEKFAGVPFREHFVPCLPSAAGDVMIAAAAYGATAVAFWRAGWPFEQRWFSPAVMWIAFGLIVTIFIERWALSVGRWSYTQEMPTLAGIGLLPLSQWLVVPAATLLLVRLAFVKRPS